VEFEMSSEDRFGGLLLDKYKLAKSNEYYNKIHPTEAGAVDAALADERAKAKLAAEAKAKKDAEAAAAKAAAATAPTPAPAPAEPPAPAATTAAGETK
jgi:NADH-quinone oxidoreductase subunit I